MVIFHQSFYLPSNRCLVRIIPTTSLKAPSCNFDFTFLLHDTTLQMQIRNGLYFRFEETHIISKSHFSGLYEFV